MRKYFSMEAVAVGDVLEISGSEATVVDVIPNLGIIIETMSGGMKLRISYLASELSMRGAKFVNKQDAMPAA